jgi:alkylation response protein AidB-like acyl-CoA dehydrogenase
VELFSIDHQQVNSSALTLPDSAIALRNEVRTFLAQELAEGSFAPECDAWIAGFSPVFSAKLGQRGWLGMTWPRKYGGHERSVLERFAVTEEFLAAGAPVAAHWVADRQTGPLLLRYGSEEQRLRFLPAIARGECYFAIGMSEPDAGSDLAAIRTHARRVGGGWRLQGRKIWTSWAHRAHYILVLCRTSPPEKDRHAGMSQMIVELSSPGVSIKPIISISGQHHFNEVAFDDVFVPDSMVLGQVGQGWKQVMGELAFERSGPERLFSTFPLLVELVRQLGPRLEAREAEALGRLAARLWTLRRMSLAVAHMLNSGALPDVEAALVKDQGTRFEREVAEVARTLLPAAPALDAPDQFNVLLAQALLTAPSFTLRGGATEILRGIVARGLKSL